MKKDPLYEHLIRPLLFSFDPEEAHALVAGMLKALGGATGLCPWQYQKKDLSADFFGKNLKNPIGLAAGFDKNGTLSAAIPGLGFGFAEIGSVCARPFGGNPRPRLFRLPGDRALINRLGLNGLGAETVAKILEAHSPALPFGINIAKTNDATISGEAAVDDILFTFKRIASVRPLYVTVNASCPNTAEGCLKESEMLDSLFRELAAANGERIPILLKLSPDSSLEFLEQVADLAVRHGISGFVCGNTTVSRNGLTHSGEALESIGHGGLSGIPLRDLNLELCRRMQKLKSKEQKLIGVGGIMTGHDVMAYMEAGASVVQIYTAMVYRGPATVKMICEELSRLYSERGLPLSVSGAEVA